MCSLKEPCKANTPTRTVGVLLLLSICGWVLLLLAAVAASVWFAAADAVGLLLASTGCAVVMCLCGQWVLQLVCTLELQEQRGIGEQSLLAASCGVAAVLWWWLLAGDWVCQFNVIVVKAILQYCCWASKTAAGKKH